MRNPEIFRDFDMVMSVTQDTLNQQFAKLVQTGVIRKQFVILKEVDDAGNFRFQKFDSSNDVPRDGRGNTAGDCLAADMKPSILIRKSGSEVTFVIEFTAGTATFLTRFGPMVKARSYNMAGWKYGVSVNLAMADLNHNDLAAGLAAPADLVARLNRYSSEMFRVSRLFLDFASIRTSDPAFISTADAGPGVNDLFTLFMQFYLRSLDARTNPFALGYALTRSPQMLAAGPASVPPALQPSGAAYNVYFDPTSPGRSTLNYALVTAGRTVPGSPAPFDSNWIGPEDTSGMKMIVSRTRLAEELFVKPMFNQVRESVYREISGKVSAGPGNDYAAARSNWTFVISKTGGNDQYENSFAVQFGTWGAQALIRFVGNILVYKRVDTDCFFCTATAWARGMVAWSGDIRLGASDFGSGPVLTVEYNFPAPQLTSQRDKNGCADFFDWIGALLNAFRDLFSTGFSPTFFMNLFRNLYSSGTPRIGNLSVVLGNFSSTVSSTMLLPAGDVLSFSNPRFSAEGDLSLTLTYR